MATPTGKKKLTLKTAAKVVNVAAVAASPAPTPKNLDNAPASVDDKGSGKTKVASSRHVDAKVAARNSALNAMGGVKVDVFVRIRPRLPMEKGHEMCVTAEDCDIVLEDPTGKPARYTYDKVYSPDATQAEVFDDCVNPIVEQVARGMSCCIFAYGQTGTGKTYTMRGELGTDVTQHGMIQRSVDALFKRLPEHEYTDINVTASFLEIYNEELEDLFVDRPKDDPLKKKSKNAAKTLTLIDDEVRGCVCQGLSELPVDSAEKTMELLREADKRCKVSETKMNKMSNRAHRIFTIIARFKRYDTDVVSTLTFVDLAGSEDILKSGATGLTAREASHINKSLLTLGRVINALACNEKHIPYRDSKLTRLLSEALGGVCKTSFIACVSPCISSATESNSTLRYAERAMEALNISQLPRWKQDEIMIDGLTRRVQQLLDQMASQDKIHREEMQEMRNQKAALVAENKELRIQMYKLTRKNEKLEVRKQALKHGLALMTQQRDTLQQQKEALRVELVKTRQERDGYLSDRNMLNLVLGTVRGMRDRLLVAHADTETSLSKDAKQLKHVIEGAIVDIDDLHAEVARKKSLSTHNENAADEFRDRMSSKLRQVVATIGEFKTQQDVSYENLHSILLGMRSSRQKECSALRQDMSKLSTKATDILNVINTQSAEFETQQKSRIARARDDSENHRDEVLVSVSNFRTAVSARVDELRSHAKALEENMQLWTDKMKSKIDETTGSANLFAKTVTQQIAAMQSSLEGASNAQLAHLKAHHGALQQHLDTEKATMAAEAERLIENVNSYIARMVTDFKNVSLRRTEQAVGGFHTTVDQLCGETRDMVSHQVAEFGALGKKTADWDQAVTASLKEGQATNAANHKSSVGLLNSTRESAREAESEMALGADTVERQGKQYFDLTVNAAKEATTAAEHTRATFDKLATNGTKDLQTDTEAIRVRVQRYAEDFTAKGEGMKLSLDSTLEHVRGHSDSTTDELFDTEAATMHYVMQTIKRDTQAPPPHKAYRYPTDYKKTDEYDRILADTKDDWKREAAMRKGTLTPGKGPDFPGELGPADQSGIVKATANKEPAEDVARALDDAAHQSEPEDYETDREGNEDDDDDEEAEHSS